MKENEIIIFEAEDKKYHITGLCEKRHGMAQR